MHSVSFAIHFFIAEQLFSVAPNSTVTIWKSIWNKSVACDTRAFVCMVIENQPNARPIWMRSNSRRLTFWFVPMWRPEVWTLRAYLSVSRRSMFHSQLCVTRSISINSLNILIPAINVTLPDEKSNYVHRIGRVGRADRMGLAISLVSTVPEKVWYHGQWCRSRGQNCWNTNLTDAKGCCMWYNEKNVSNIWSYPSRTLDFELNI